MKNIFKILLVLFAIQVQAQIIVIDPGHGYGATTSDNPDGRTATEIETSLEVGLRTRNLIQGSCNWTVYMTRTTNLNSWISVTQRAQMSNNWNADRLLSIHCNAGGGTGTETFYCTQDDTTTAPDIAFAQKIQTDMVANGQWNNRRCVEDNSFLAYHLGVLRYSSATGCLNEIGFVDSADATKLNSSTWRDTFALSYFNTLKSNLGITCAAVPAPGAFTLTATPECNGTTSRIALSWTASANASSYDLYKDGALWDSNLTSTTYTNSNGVNAGGTYSYSVKAKNASTTQTTNSNGNVSITALNCAIPDAFTLTATPICNGTTAQVNLSWTASTNATKYDIYKNGTLLTANTTTTSYIDSGLTYNTAYSYLIKAKSDNATVVDNSNGAQGVTTLNCNPIPGPFTLTVTPECSTTNTSRNKLTWTASANATTYSIYRNGALYASSITGTTYTNTAVTAGVSYSYYVVAKNSTTTTVNNSNGSQTVITNNCAVPGTFTLTATPSCNTTISEIALSWTAATNADSYDVYCNNVLIASNITSTNYTNTALTAGTSYAYYIKAKSNSSTQTTNSNGTLTVTALDCNPIPGAFTLTVTSECSTTGTPRNKLIWTASANATGYNLYRNGVLYASSITGTTYTNTAVTTGTTYTYYVKAKNATTTQTTNSNGTQSITTINCAAPGSFALTATPECNNGTSQINLSWTASANATNYDIYRNSSLYASDVTGTAFANTYITAGTAYTYSVVAKNNIGTLTNSNGTISTTALTCPPGSFTATATPTCSGTSSAINLTWTAATGATGYDIYRNGNLYASDITGTTFLNTYLITAGTTYTYYVKAKNSIGSINNSNGTLSVVATNCSAARESQETTFQSETISLKMYPNPTDGIINLEFNKEITNPIEYFVLDIQGKIIKQESTKEKVIDISNLPSGTYFIKVNTEEKEFVKQILKK